MNQNSNITSSSTSERIETVSMSNETIVLSESVKEQNINRNKPWRVVIRRIVSDGGSTYEDISGENGNN